MNITKKIIILAVNLCLICNCSFQSKQFDFVKSLVNEQTNDGPRPNWLIEWAGINLEMFAVNHENRIFFVNYDGYFLEFRDKQLVKAEGFFDLNERMEIELSDQNLSYIYNNTPIKTDICESWSQLINTNSGLNSQEQICFALGSDYNYKNKIYFNNDSQIIALEYKLHPDYPSIKLRLFDYD